jgi:hypothetical protein
VHYDDTLRRVWQVAFFLSALAKTAIRKAYRIDAEAVKGQVTSFLGDKG